MVPIFKAGDRKIKIIYRPISILLSFDKTLEKIVACQLENDSNENNILTPHDFGFRRGISKEKAVQNLLNQVNLSSSDDELIVCTLLDLTDAFELVNRSCLLRKLSLYGIQDQKK